MRPIHVLALVATAALLAVAVVLVTGEGGAPAAPLELPDPVARGAAAPRAELDKPAQGAAAPAPERPREVATQPARAGRSRGALAGTPERELLWVTGSVVLPPGARPDEGLRVLSVREPERERSLSGPFAAWMSRAAGPKRESDVLWASAVEPDGTFRVACAPGATWAWLDVEGELLYLPQAHAVRLEGAETRCELSPRLGAAIRGRWQAPSGAAGRDAVLGGGTAWLAPPDSDGMAAFLRPEDERAPVFHVVQTGPDGAFEMRGVDPDVEWVLVSQPAWLASTTTELELERGQVADVEVELQRGGGVAGRVVDGRGGPVAGATVTLSVGAAEGEEDEEGEVLGLTTESRRRKLLERVLLTLGDGTFTAHGLPPGEVVVRAEKDGYRRGIRKKADVAAGELASGIELKLRRGEALRGVVAWADGRPAPGAVLQVGRDASGLAEPVEASARAAYGEYEADARGAFEITGLKRRPQSVWAFATRRAGERWVEGTAQLDGVEPSEDDALEVVLAERPLLCGRVRTPEGEPVTRFRLVLRPDAGAASFLSTMMSQRGTEERDVTSAEGEFRLERLGAGDFSLTVEAEGYATSPPVGFRLPAEPGTPPLEISLRAFASVAGRVLDPFGEPFVDAEVTIAAGGTAGSGEASFLFQAPSRRPVHTNARGEFAFPALEPGAVTLQATGGTWVESLEVSLDLAPGEQREGVAVLLRRGARLEGEALDASGEPLAEHRVQVRPERRGPRGPWDFEFQAAQTTQTDARGWFELEGLPPGPSKVTLRPPDDPASRLEQLGYIDGDSEEIADVDWSRFGKVVASADVDLLDGETTRIVLGGAPAEEVAPVALSGRVTLRGRPARGTIELSPATPRPGAKAVTATLGADGAYALEVAPGEWDVEVETEAQSHDFACRVPRVERHRLDVALPTGRIAGRVLRPDGSPAGGTGVSLQRLGAGGKPTDMSSLFGQEEVGDDGAYEFEDLAPGTYVVRAGGAMISLFMGNAMGVGRTCSPPIALAADEDRRGVDVVLGDACELAGRVVDEAGAPRSGVSIHLYDAAGTPLDAMGSARTNAAGRFVCEGIAPGTYTVLARSGTSASRMSGPVAVRAAGADEVELVLAGGTVLVVSLRDVDGELLRASVSVVDERGREHGGLIGYGALFFGEMGGEAPATRVGPLAPGAYTVRARTQDGRGAERALVLRSSSPEELPVDLAVP